MKKIGLLTFASNLNYGSWCLTYALYIAIKNRGYDIEIIDYHYNECEKQDGVTWMDFVNGLLNSSFCMTWQKSLVKKGLDKERDMFWKKSKKRYTPDNIAESNGVYDVFLIGSDQVWDHRFGGASLNFYLDFASHEKGKIAFAASSGYTALSYKNKEQDEFSRYLNEFDYIAVREPNLKEMLGNAIHKNVPIVCDPTMLLDNSVWKSFVSNNKPRRPYILMYIVDDLRMIDIATHYARKHGFDILNIGFSQGNDDRPNRFVKMIQPAGVSEWISLIYYAEKVFTGSYHATLFSIYLQREFSFYYRRPLIRFSYISKKLKLEQYEIHHANFDVEKKIEWEEIKSAENSFREYSMRILEEMLNVVYEGDTT